MSEFNLIQDQMWSVFYNKFYSAQMISPAKRNDSCQYCSQKGQEKQACAKELSSIIVSETDTTLSFTFTIFC